MVRFSYSRKSPRYSRSRGRTSRKYNRKYKVFGATPDYMVSPIDFIPGGSIYSKGRKTSKLARRLNRKTKASYKVYKRSKSRGSRKSSSSRRNVPRGKFYYYRGKRYYRK